MTDDRPPGWSYNPSAWSERLPVLALALAGCAIATYLALYQLDVVAHVWEPFFGSGSWRILKESSIAHLLPIPDALLGAGVYLLDATADVLGGRTRWRTLPWAVLLLGLISASLGAGGVLLAICQPVLFRAYCTLCLASAACSVLMVGVVMAEVLATLQHLRRQSAQGRSLWSALWSGTEHGEPADQTHETPGSGGFSGWVPLFGALLGVWLMAAPSVLGYGGAAWMNDRVIGPLAAGLGVIAAHQVLRPLRRVQGVLGLWLLLAPWILAYPRPALLNSMAIGLLLLACALVPAQARDSFGGGWSALWQPHQPGTE